MAVPCKRRMITAIVNAYLQNAANKKLPMLPRKTHYYDNTTLILQNCMEHNQNGVFVLSANHHQHLKYSFVRENQLLISLYFIDRLIRLIRLV